MIEIEEVAIIRFSSVENALRWAIETASIPNVKSPTFVNCSRLGKAKRSDYFDLALSILNRMNWIESKLQRDTLKFVYHGGGERLIALCDVYAKQGGNNPLIHYVALLNEYSHVWFGKEISDHRAEQILGCKKGELRRYSELLKQAKLHIAENVQDAELKVAYNLKDLGVV